MWQRSHMRYGCLKEEFEIHIRFRAESQMRRRIAFSYEATANGRLSWLSRTTWSGYVPEYILCGSGDFLVITGLWWWECHNLLLQPHSQPRRSEFLSVPCSLLPDHSPFPNSSSVLKIPSSDTHRIHRSTSFVPCQIIDFVMHVQCVLACQHLFL